MDAKFLVELPENEEIIDLVGLMAHFTGAAWRVVSTLETADERLARAVCALTGQRLDTQDWLGGELDMAARIEQRPAELPSAPVVEAEGAPITSWAEAAAAVMSEAATTLEKTGRVCEYCGDAVGPRRRCCNKAECKRKQQSHWQATYDAKKRTGQAVSADVAEEAAEPGEVAADEVPFAMMGEMGMHLILTGSLAELEYPAAEVAKMIQAGRLQDGERIRAQPSGKYYEVRGGMLVLVAEPALGISGEAGRGAEEMAQQAA